MANESEEAEKARTAQVAALLETLTPIVAREWENAKVVLQNSGVRVEPWPEDERLVHTVDCGAGTTKALKFGVHVEAGDQIEERVRAHMAELAPAIFLAGQELDAEPVVYVRVAPSIAPFSDGSVIVRCRVGFGQTFQALEDARVVEIAQPEDVTRRTILSDDQIAYEARRARYERTGEFGP